MLGLALISTCSFAEEATTIDAILDPTMEREAVIEPKIDNENIEIGAYFGIISIEDFGTSSIIGAHINYHANEDIFLQLNLANAEAEQSSWETLVGAELFSDRDFSFYTLSAGLNLFPGESFFWGGAALTSSIYTLVGFGNTNFADEDHFSLTLGAGYKLLINDWAALHLQMNDLLYDSDIISEEKTTHNMMWQLGASFFF